LKKFLLLEQTSFSVKKELMICTVFIEQKRILLVEEFREATWKKFQKQLEQKSFPI
jgi:hypothetical protein